MEIKDQRPFFIIVDGGDGSGKDTQAKFIAHYCKTSGYNRVRIRSHPALDNRFGRKTKEALERGGKRKNPDLSRKQQVFSSSLRCDLCSIDLLIGREG